MFDFTRQYEFEVKIGGRALTEYPHTDGNIYVEGRPGSEYTLYFKNNGYDDVVAIPSVDGLSVFDGKPAGKDSKGYIVDAYASINIPGWTLNSNEVARFTFGDVRESYSVQSNQGASNVGVIGLLVFRRNLQPQHHGIATASVFGSGGIMRGMTHDSFNLNSIESQSVGATMSAQDMGTGFGKAQDFKTVEAKFEKRDPNHPDALMALYYDSAKGLARRGINVSLKHNPSPFPTYVNTISCTPPPGWVKK